MPAYLELKAKLTINAKLMNEPNLCYEFDKEDLTAIGKAVVDGYKADLNSRETWQRRNEAGMDLALQVAKGKTWPWANCSNVIFPLVTIGALQFSSRAYGNIISGPDIVRCRVVGEDPQGSLQQRADRISNHMSWQCLEQDSGWEEQHDRLFINEAIVGTAFIKSYFDGKRRHNVSELVLAKDLILNYYAKSVDSCPRKTHVVILSRNDIYERVKRGTFHDVLEEPWFKSHSSSPTQSATAPAQARQDQRQGIAEPPVDAEAPFVCLEQHRLLDLDQDGYAEPYIVTVEESSQCVLRIVARWDSEKQVERTDDKEIICINATEYFTKFGFIPSPDGGIYDIGFGVLLGPLNEAVNTSINQLIDSGTMQTSLGGFLGRGAKIRGGEYAMAPWEWKRVDSTGDDLRKSVVPFPDRQPSVVLFNLLNLLIEYTNRVASTSEIMVGKTPGQNTPAETTRNAFEQGMQVFSTIFKRIWRSMKEEFKKLHRLNAIHLTGSFAFGAGNAARREDYATGSEYVIPSADPNITSMSMRFFQAQAIREASQQVAGYDITYVEKQFLRAMRVESIDKYFPGPEKVPPPPNPKVQVAEMQIKIKQTQLRSEELRFIADLMEQKRLNTAKIVQLRAAAAADIAGIGEAQAAIRMQHLQMVLDAFATHNEMINERIAALASVKAEDEGKPTATGEGNEPQSTSPPTDGGGVPGLEDLTGDEGSVPVDDSMGEELGGAMEGEVIPER